MFSWTSAMGPRRRLGVAIGAVALLVALWLGWRAIPGAGPGSAPPAARAPQRLDPAPAPVVLVFVSGAVANPGLYRLSPDARLADALAAAGGVTPQADLGRLPDLASRVHDGKQVNVPFVHTGSRGSGSATGAKLDVNSASLAELAAVPGMPAGLPEAIVEHRDRFGAFISLADLRDSLGVDRTAMAALGSHLRVVYP